jgi:EAL domain-containing protein (putative c-di-GMP-specific phosphodiesterase class I)
MRTADGRNFQLRHSRGLRIGIIDDDAELAGELAELLRATGNAVEQISADDFVARKSRLDHDVLILDVVMPGIDGLDVLKRAIHSQRPPAIILMSGHDEALLQGAAEAAQRSGLAVVGGLSKPFAFDELLRLTDRARFPTAQAAAPATCGFAIRSAVATAIAEHRLAVAFQPIVRADTLAFAGAEALLQGGLPGLPPVSPAAIVEAVAVDEDLLAALSWSVVRQAAEACRRWTQRGYRGPVAVNLPASVLQAPEAVETLRHVMGGAGLAPEQLSIELIEENVYDGAADTLAALVKLRVAGFGLLLDDVGRRESGLTQLSSLPVTGLKIDIALLRAARRWEKSRRIFAALARLGADLGLTVTAEGVETAEDAAFAHCHGVSFFQGFLFARKLPLPDLMATLPTLQRTALAACRQLGEIPLGPNRPEVQGSAQNFDSVEISDLPDDSIRSKGALDTTP